MSQLQDTQACPVQGLMVTEEMIIQRFECKLQIFAGSRDDANKLYDDYKKVLSDFPGWEITMHKLEYVLMEYLNGPKKAREPGELPKELCTPAAMELWVKARKAGFVDEQLQPINFSRAQCALLADVMGEQLHLKYRWRPFEIAWNIKNLRTDNQNLLIQPGESEFRKKVKEALL